MASWEDILGSAVPVGVGAGTMALTGNPMAAAGAGSGAGFLMDAILGNPQEKAARARAARLQALRQQAYGGLAGDIPNLDEGIDYSKWQAPDSLMKDVNMDPQYDAAIRRTLGGLEDYSQSGMNEQDKYDLMQVQQQQAAQERQNRQAILREAASRGGPQSLDYAAMLMGNQGAADQAAMQGAQVASGAAQRRMDALRSVGDLGMKAGGQKFDQDAAKAQSQDIVNQFNANMLRTADTTKINNKQSAFNNKVTVGDKMFNSGVSIDAPVSAADQIGATTSATMRSQPLQYMNNLALNPESSLYVGGDDKYRKRADEVRTSTQNPWK